MTILEKDMLEVVLIKGKAGTNATPYIPPREGYFTTVEVETQVFTQPTFGESSSVGILGSELKRLWRMASFDEVGFWILGPTYLSRNKCTVALKIMEVFWKTEYMYKRIASPWFPNQTAFPFLGLAPITYNAATDTITFCMISTTESLPTNVKNPFYREFEFDINDYYTCRLGPNILPVLERY